MEENNTVPQPASAGAPGKLTIEPTGDVAAAKINVGNFEPPVPTVSAAPTPPTGPAQPAEQEWKPESKPAFSSPRAVLLFSLLGLFATLMLFTFGISVNAWLKMIIILALSLAGMFFATRAYRSDQDVNILVALMISTTLFVGTVIIGGSYTYYYIKLKQVTSSLRNYSY